MELEMTVQMKRNKRFIIITYLVRFAAQNGASEPQIERFRVLLSGYAKMSM